jgi:hypothetical protein
MRFLHDGQLTGARLRVPVQLTRRSAEPLIPEVAKIYEQLLEVLPCTSVGRGHAEVLKPRQAWIENPTAENFVLVQWQSVPKSFDLVVVNLASHQGQCYVPLRIPNLSNSNWEIRDLLGTEHFVRSGSDLESNGLYLDVPAQAAQLFHFTPERS